MARDLAAPSPTGAALGRRGRSAAILALAAAVAVMATWSDQLAELGGDSATYLLTARHWAPFLAPDAVAASVADASPFPPLYPALLAVTGGAADVRVAHAVTTLCLLAALGALYIWLRIVGLPRATAGIVTGAFALAPATVTVALPLKSESLFLALTLAGLIALARATAADRPSRYWIATACFAAAMLTRSAGIALVPAMLVTLLPRRPRGWYWMPLALVAPSMAWAALRQAPAYGSVLATYLEAPWAVVVEQLAINAQALALGFAATLLRGQALIGIAAVLALLSLVTLAHRARRWHADAWYVLASLAMLVVWPFPEEAARLLWVVLPLLLGYAAMTGHDLVRRLAAHSPRLASVGAIAPLLLLLMAGISAHGTLARALRPADPALKRLPEWYGADVATAQASAEAHLTIVSGVAELGALVPDGACIHSIRPSLVAFLAHRPGRAPPAAHVSDEAFERWAQGTECRHVLLLAASDAAFPVPYYPWDRLGERLELVAVRTAPGDASGRIAVALGRIRD